MRSIFQKALGEKFDRLHPELQKKFGVTSEQNLMLLGQGRMTEIRGTAWMLRPLMNIGTGDNLIFSERGREVPFTMENYLYKDERGNETISYVRRFFFPYSIRGFDAAMYYDEKEEAIVNELGKSGRFHTKLEVDVSKEGGILINSQDINLSDSIKLQNFTTSLYEHYNEDEQAHQVHVHVEHPFLGTLLMYEGLVYTEFLPITATHIPQRGLLS
ncbi:DUF4166 domain-containing protein [Halobacillus sp. Marseille-Q1614]|uniref:DUF4166 domain-containing protein n=1 Tax=Halobacillus sp. Marseille-Q1614 TaxID=2709134 RepID=UPI0015713108|nr:DUF4166 domain-containing protein [Halobacillus sp. Marseille-Q1614]